MCGSVPISGPKGVGRTKAHCGDFVRIRMPLVRCSPCCAKPSPHSAGFCMFSILAKKMPSSRGTLWPHSQHYHSLEPVDDSTLYYQSTPKNHSQCQAFWFMPWAADRCRVCAQHLGFKIVQLQKKKAARIRKRLERCRQLLKQIQILRCPT